MKAESEGTRLRIRVPSHATAMNTDGWRAVIGDLGKNQPRLELWYDRFSGYTERKLYACFRSDVRQQIISMTKRVSQNLWPVRVVSLSDTSEENHFVLKVRLARPEFNVPILEKYYGGSTFYGIYDPTRDTGKGVSPHFLTRAQAFFHDVVRALPHAIPEEEDHDAYPQFENRKSVVSHLHRERSRYLAAECKIRDNYVCQVCGLRFEDVYGKLGAEFSEAHHRIPLNQLRGSVRTRLEDLITVCANCHRMLHHMQGRRDDVERLRAIVRRLKQS